MTQLGDTLLRRAPPPGQEPRRRRGSHPRPRPPARGARARRLRPAARARVRQGLHPELREVPRHPGAAAARDVQGRRPLRRRAREERERLGRSCPAAPATRRCRDRTSSDLPADPVVPKRDQQHAIPMRTWLVVGRRHPRRLPRHLGRQQARRRTVARRRPCPTTRAGDDHARPGRQRTTARGRRRSTRRRRDRRPPTPRRAATEGVTPFKLTFRIRPGETRPARDRRRRAGLQPEDQQARGDAVVRRVRGGGRSSSASRAG